MPAKKRRHGSTRINPHLRPKGACKTEAKIFLSCNALYGVNALTDGDYKGCTPFDVAKKQGYTEGARLLEKAMPSFAKEDDDRLLALVKGLYLPTFPASEGYLPAGRAFGKYFDDPKWIITDKQREYMRMVFTGVFDNNGKKALFDLELKVSDISKPAMLPVCAWVNRRPQSEDAHNDMLFAAFLETK